MITRKRAAILLAGAIAFAGIVVANSAHSDNSVSRYPIVAGEDDAWQRGTPSQQYGQDATAPFEYLGRSDDPSMRMNSGLRFHTDLAPGEQVKAAFLEGWNNFGQSTTMYIYGDMTPGQPDFRCPNEHLPSCTGSTVPPILSRPHTQRPQSWVQTYIPMRTGFTPDVSPIVNELTKVPGFNGTLTFLLLGGGGSDNQSIDWRSYEYGANVPLLHLER